MTLKAGIAKPKTGNACQQIQSAMAGIAWPALPDSFGTTLLAVQYQLEQSQWHPPEKLQALQRKQLALMVEHAVQTVPYYHQAFRHFGANPDPDSILDNWAQVPLLSREVFAQKIGQFTSHSVPAKHGKAFEFKTRGTTAEAVKVLRTELAMLFMDAILLRDKLWQQRDCSGHLAILAPNLQITDATGFRAFPSWGGTLARLYETGPSTVISALAPVETQAEIMRDRNPDYLMATPTQVLALARHFARQHDSTMNLRQVITGQEPLTDEIRKACKQVWNVEVKDAYSATETGYLALQCPETENYHIQSETLLVEILDQRGLPCAPGQTGNVFITTLHNFVMPLIRYHLGDAAVVGETCRCGRGLPVVQQILGRSPASTATA